MDGGGTDGTVRRELGKASCAGSSCDTNGFDIRYSRVIRCAVLDVSDPLKVCSTLRASLWREAAIHIQFCLSTGLARVREILLLLANQQAPEAEPSAE